MLYLEMKYDNVSVASLYLAYESSKSKAAGTRLINSNRKKFAFTDNYYLIS